MEVGSFEAKNEFSALLERAEAGEEIVMTRRGRPIAKLVSIADGRTKDRAREAACRLRERAGKHGGHFEWDEWNEVPGTMAGREPRPRFVRRTGVGLFR